MMFLDFREITEALICASVTCAAHLRRSLGYVNTGLLMDVMTIVTVLTYTSAGRNLIRITRDWRRHIVGSHVRHAGNIMAVVTTSVNSACRSISYMTGLASRQG
jgi:hypothetical protein